MGTSVLANYQGTHFIVC